MENISCCGADCSACGCFGKMCDGCNACFGTVFHAPQGRACPIYECSINQSGLKNCGECERVPCEIWRKTKDPSFTDEAFERNIQERLARLNKA